MPRDPVRALLIIEAKQALLLEKKCELDAKLAVLTEKRIRAVHRLRGRDMSRYNALRASGEEPGLLLARLDREAKSIATAPF